MTVEGAPSLDVGSSYLLGLIRESGAPALPSPRSALALADGQVAGLPDASPEATIADDLRGLEPRQAVDLVLDAPLLVSDRSLSPDDRYDELLKAGG